MLELVIAENKMLKAKLAQLKGSNATVTTPQPPSNNAGPASRATGNVNHSEPATSVSSKDESADAMDDSASVSPPLKRRAKETGPNNPSTSLGSDNKYVTEGGLHSFGEQITENLSATFKAMLAEFADTIGTQITGLNERVGDLENGSFRTLRGGGAGSMKSTKPYSRPPLADSFKAPTDHA